MAEVVTDAPEVPLPERKPLPHDCGREIRDAEGDWARGDGFDSYRRFGMVVRCSCGRLYRLRALSMLRSMTFLGRGALESRWRASQYWARIRKGYS